jgi:HSP20 family protein
MMYPVLSNNWLDNEFNDMFSDDWFPTVSHRSLTAPAINVKETDKDYELELAAPGSTKEDFQVNLDKDGNLVIKMEHKNEKKDENKKEHYLRREFSYSNYQQALTLPDDVEKDKISAKVEHGVLHVIMPRAAQVKKDDTKKIDVA